MSEQDMGEARMDGLIQQAAGERQALVRALREVEQLRQRERKSRYLSLRIHAWMAVLIGFAILFSGAPQIFENQIGTWMRPFLGTLAVISGFVLLLGVDTQGHHRKHYIEVTGLALKGAWDGIMAFSLIWSIYLYGHVAVKAPWDLSPIDPLQPRPFGPYIYLGLFSFVALVHLPACWRDLHTRADTLDTVARG